MTPTAVLLRKIRARVFDYPEEKEAQVARVLRYLVTRKIRIQQTADRALPRGPYSGLTSAQLRQSRTCEPDWF